MSTMRNSVMLIGRPTKPVMNGEENQASFKLVVTDERKVDGCSSSQISRAFRYGRKVHGYTISDRHPMDAIMQEIEQRDKQPYKFNKL